MANKKAHKGSIVLNGIFKENPVLVMLLGLCPVLPATTSIMNAVTMFVAVLFVLFFSNLLISLLKTVIPHEIRIPVYIVIIATLVTVIDLLLQAFTPQLSTSLGVFIPLITVNCIILGRAEAFASKNSVGDSLLDAIGMAVGFGFACLLIAIFRELLGTGGFTFFNPFNSDDSVTLQIIPSDYVWSKMTDNIGGFLVFGLVLGAYNAVMSAINTGKQKKAMKAQQALQAQGGK